MDVLAALKRTTLKTLPYTTVPPYFAYILFSNQSCQTVGFTTLYKELGCIQCWALAKSVYARINVSSAASYRRGILGFQLTDQKSTKILNAAPKKRTFHFLRAS